MGEKLTADAVLATIAGYPAAMQALDAPACVLQHVSERNPGGPDVRLDSCPCSRGPETVTDVDQPVELGGGQYLSSGRHTLGDVVRDLTAV